MIIVARKWRTQKIMVALFVIELFFTVAALTVYALAQPDLYRTRLWQDGSDNGFNSSPSQKLYNYTNGHGAYKVPIVWSQFITDYNVVISVLSMFILLAKVVMFVMHLFIPLISILTHVALVALYVVSTYAQTAPDMSDPDHPQPGAPWYITKKCSVVYTQSNYGYCQQAKASFAVTICMVVLFSTYLILAIFSSIPTKGEKLARVSNLQRSDLPAYAPETMAANERPQWEKRSSQVRLTQLRSPVTASARNPNTPRTVAFQTLEGGRHGSSTKSLPFRERYGD